LTRARRGQAGADAPEVPVVAGHARLVRVAGLA
jgi:hypothetical protein